MFDMALTCFVKLSKSCLDAYSCEEEEAEEVAAAEDEAPLALRPPSFLFSPLDLTEGAAILFVFETDESRDVDRESPLDPVSREREGLGPAPFFTGSSTDEWMSSAILEIPMKKKEIGSNTAREISVLEK